MNSTLERKFEDMGARVKFNARSTARRGMNTGMGVRLNVLSDKNGEFFEVAVNGDPPEMQVLDVQPEDRHLLLLIRGAGGEKSKLLCGHDERHWFVAAIPENAPVGTVRQAKEALKPQEVQSRQVGLNAKKRNKRKTNQWRRSGEWFYIPEDINPKAELILKNEPITRGTGSKPHMCEFMYRSGGESVYVCGRYPNGVDINTYNRLIRTENAKSWGWRVMTKDAKVYVKGRITHPDHKTITLPGWCWVLMNEEGKSRAMKQVAFLD